MLISSWQASSSSTAPMRIANLGVPIIRTHMHTHAHEHAAVQKYTCTRTFFLYCLFFKFLFLAVTCTRSGTEIHMCTDTCVYYVYTCILRKSASSRNRHTICCCGGSPHGTPPYLGAASAIGIWGIKKKNQLSLLRPNFFGVDFFFWYSMI